MPSPPVLHDGGPGAVAVAARPPFDPSPSLAEGKPLTPDDDCVPIEPPVVKPKVTRQSVFADGPAKPRDRSFSEQVQSARKRIAPAVVKPSAPDC
jgi:hypothetical protein